MASALLAAAAVSGCAGSAVTPSAAPTPHSFSTPTFMVTVPAGWHARTIDNRGAAGVLYGVATTTAGVPESGVAPPGMIGMQFAVIPVGSVPTTSGNLGAMTPDELLEGGEGFPEAATNESVGPQTALSLDGNPAAIETLTYIYDGSAQRDEAVATRRDDTLYLVTVDATTLEYPAADRDFRALLLSWHWSA